MKKKSLWLEGIESQNCSPLKSDIECDVLIIGGGMTGLSTAYHLKNSSLDICIVEQDLVAHGVSSKTTGKLTYLQELIYSTLTKNYSKSHAKLYLNSQIEAIKLVEQIVNENSINCDYHKVNSYIFTDKIDNINKIKEEKALLESFGIKVEEFNELPINLKSYCTIKVTDTAVFHPVKYLNALKNILLTNNINIYEKTKVTELKKEDGGYICYANKHKIRAKTIVLACHYPFFIWPFIFPLKGYLERSYISASKVDESRDVSIINIDKKIKSVRYHNDYLIYLTGSHSLATKYNVSKSFELLLADLNKYNLKPDFIWSNYDIITNDSLPYIGYIDDNLIIGTGYNTWGMTNGSLAGEIISDLILKKDNKYARLFDPRRNQGLTGVVGTLVDIYSSAKPFIENKIIKNKSFYPDNVRFEMRDGQPVGIYVDRKGNEHIVRNKCPHLKCSLIFNEIEKTWDCPCHGSRFDIDGNCIQGPSSYDISYKPK